MTTISFCNRANRRTRTACMRLFGHKGLHEGADPNSRIDSSRTIRWRSQSLDDVSRFRVDYGLDID